MLAPAPRSALALVIAVSLGVLDACADGAARDAEVPPEGGRAPVAADDASACAPDRVGLTAARAVPLWLPPEGCTRANQAGQTATVRSEAELAAQYTCPAGVTIAIDFARDQLVLADRMLSPAQTGSDLYDDGTTVTFVSRQRMNCPDDPRPMPTPYTVGFLLPAGSDRVYAEASCAVKRVCP